MSLKTRVGTVTLLAITLSCAWPRTFLNPEADWSFYKQLGVLPFANLSADRYAGEKVQSAFITEMYLSERFQIMEPGEFNQRATSYLKSVGVQPGQELSLENIKAVGEKNGVQGVIEGTVRDYSMVRVGQAEYPLISLSLRMVDVPTGTVVWMSSYTMKGGPRLPVISVGETHTLSELTQKICKKMVSDFVGKAF